MPFRRSGDKQHGAFAGVRVHVEQRHFQSPLVNRFPPDGLQRRAKGIAAEHAQAQRRASVDRRTRPFDEPRDLVNKRGLELIFGRCGVCRGQREQQHYAAQQPHDRLKPDEPEPKM